MYVGETDCYLSSGEGLGLNKLMFHPTSSQTCWVHSTIFVHLLQLPINGFKIQHINHVVVSASHLVSHFLHRKTATQLQHLAEQKLVQYGRTRWNSIHDMFQQLLEQRISTSVV